jgi:hypothetical protein
MRSATAAERIGEIAREYVRSPERTLVVSPDNESRREINSTSIARCRTRARSKGTSIRCGALCAAGLTGADRQHAQNYERAM